MVLGLSFLRTLAGVCWVKAQVRFSSVLKNDKPLRILISNLHFHRQKPQNRPRTAPLSMEMQVVVGDAG
ncbi:hypothetical protein AOT31_08815 [Corynebacterium ulcerans]|nr:hypothetical protein AOT31_08815 [Corynebacterium ulcerans]